MSETAIKAESTDQEKAKDITDSIANAVREFQSIFKCRRCGKCCQEGVGVALWRHEVKKLARIEPHLMRHTFVLNNWTCLKMPCAFYRPPNKLIPGSTGKCRIYSQRPIACRMYPLAINRDGSIKKSANCPALKPKE